MDIFNKSIDEIFTTNRLKSTLISLKKRPKDYDEILISIESESFIANIRDGFIPQPVWNFNW